MSIGHVRPRKNADPHAGWRERTSASVVPFVAPRAEQGQIAFAFSLGGPITESVGAALASLHVTTIARAFDAAAVKIVAAADPVLVVLACDPTKADDLRAIAQLAEQGSWRLLVLDTNDTVPGASAALDAGADVVLSNHSEVTLIRATLRAMLRQSRLAGRPVPAREELSNIVGGLTIDQDTFEVRDAGELVSLTPTEFKVLADLARHVGFVRTPAQLMSALHDYSVSEVEARQTVRVYVRRIRNKLGAGERPSVEVVSYRGRGYRLEPAEPRSADTETSSSRAGVRLLQLVA